MINQLFFSIAGKKANSAINTVLEQLLEDNYILKSDKDVLSYSLDVASKGAYPSREYYAALYTAPPSTKRSVPEIIALATKIQDFYCVQHLQKSLIGIINDATDSKSLVEQLEVLVTSNEQSSEEVTWNREPITYKDRLAKPTTSGFFLGISEVDSVTNGFQPGTIATVAAFTGHGKSTALVSAMYNNIMKGKKGVFFSLELAPDLVWAEFQSRYLYEAKGVEVTVSELQQQKLSPEVEKKVLEYDEDFRNEMKKNLIVVDESFLTKQRVLDYRKLTRAIKPLEEALGGLDFIVFDHVGQLELLYPTQGNIILKQIQAFTKTYTDTQGNHPVCLWAVQCNREGEKRARTRKGVYDIQAISDLNEVERSSSYIIFLYTTEDMVVVQETKLMMAKNRLGPTIYEPFIVHFNPAVCVVGQNSDAISATDDINFLADTNYDFSDDLDF